MITLLGANPLTLELGSPFADPGATATDTCAGSVPVSLSGSVNPDAVATYTLTYSADDGAGNTNSITRSVIVQDTTAPTIQSSFTNLVLAADTNCSATLPDLTTTNYLQVSDLSAPLTLTQDPTNGTVLAEGTHPVVLSASDPYGNSASLTNTVLVQDQAPPVFWSQPISQTRNAGTSTSFDVVATDCSPITFQWYFNNSALAGQTNATLLLSELDSTLAGNYYAVATAIGGSSTSEVAVLTVKLIPSTVALSSSEDPSGFKDDIHFTAAVTPTEATGSVQFLTNNAVFDAALLTSGNAMSLPANTWPRGTNFITAVYSGNTVYLPSTNTFAQVVTNHPPVATTFFTNRYAGFALQIPVADLATYWSDVDGDPIALARIGTSTNGVAITNIAGTLVYANTNDVNDAFLCAISDDWGGTNYQTVNITVLPLPGNATPGITSVAGSTNNTILLHLTGSPGFTYILETTTNLAGLNVWRPLATNTLGTNGAWQFSESSRNYPQRFYRLELAQ